MESSFWEFAACTARLQFQCLTLTGLLINHLLLSCAFQFCRYLQALLSQLGAAARREAVLGWPPKHIHDPFGCGQDAALSSHALQLQQRVPCVSHLWPGWHKVVGSGFLDIVWQHYGWQQVPDQSLQPSRKTAETATMASVVCRSQAETTGTDFFLADAEPGHRSLVELSL